MAKIHTYLEKSRQKHLEELKEFLRIPSISAQTEHKEDIQKAAAWLKSHLQKIGMQNCKVIKTRGHPVVYAEWQKAKKKPTVLIYGHYDVQSPDPLKEWKSDPFEPEIRKGNLYARGASDDKGQLFTHIKALEAILNTRGKLPVNVKFLIEGEEEVGGPSLDEFVLKNKRLLKADICVISDSHALSPTQPLIDYGLRGIVYAQIDLSVMPQDVHSGLYGGNVPNAAIELANILAKLKDEKTQKVLIPGFYDKVRKLSVKERSDLKKSSLDSKTVLKETSAKKVLGVKGFSVAERGGARPTLDVHGILSGYTGEGPKTIIPAKASAKVSVRIVPNQTHKEVSKKFVGYVKKLAPDYVDLNIEIISTGEPILMNRSNNFFKVAELAFEDVFGSKPIYELSGGSIPVTATLKQVLGIDSILMGFGLPDDNLHAPNEKLNLETFHKGIKTSTLFFLSS